MSVIKRRWLWFLIILVIGAGVIGRFSLKAFQLDGPVMINGTAVPPIPTLDSDRVANGRTLYGQNCASCHGENLEGAPNWKKSLPDGTYPPPPHDSSGHTWHHADVLLLRIIADGGDAAFNSKMPAFKDKLAEDQMRLILDFIKSNWAKNNREFQWWNTSTNPGP